MDTIKRLEKLGITAEQIYNPTFKGLDNTTQYVFLYLLRIEDHKTHEFFYKQKTIAENIDRSISAVATAFFVLRECRIIIVCKRRRLSNIYRIINFLGM